MTDDVGHASKPLDPQVELPALTADEALRFVALLERISAAIWRAHGEEMGELLLSDPSRRRPLTDLSADPFEEFDDDLPF